MNIITKSFLKRGFSTLEKTVPVVDITKFVANQSSELECKRIASSLSDYGCVIVKDPRVNENHNKQFLDTMEKYFESRG